MDDALSWQNVFLGWPADLPRSGLLVTSFQETISFQNFRVTGGLLFLERDRPDSLGARKVLLGFSSIEALKLTEPREFEAYEQIGFGG